MLKNIKLKLNINDNKKDELLLLFITEAKDEIINITHNVKLLDNVSLINQMVVYKYNRQGTEGINSENYNGASFNYSADYPDNILKILSTNTIMRCI